MINIYNELLNSGQLKQVYDNKGIYAFSGLYLTVCQEIDNLFVEIARSKYKLTNERYPATLPIKELNKIDYFKKFPSFPFIQYAINNNSDMINSNIANDAKFNKIENDYFLNNNNYMKRDFGQVFNPSTCYHTFVNRKNMILDDELSVITAVSQCGRNENIFDNNPMRLLNFTMRECVFIGKKELIEKEAENFFESICTEIKKLTPNITVEFSNDIFFGENHEVIQSYQKEAKCKMEMNLPIYSIDGEEKVINLACASRNLHKKFLCKAFNITANDFIVESACVAIGIERLAYAILTNCGMDPQEWNQCKLKNKVLDNM